MSYIYINSLYVHHLKNIHEYCIDYINTFNHLYSSFAVSKLCLFAELPNFCLNPEGLLMNISHLVDVPHPLSFLGKKHQQ